MPNFRWFWLWWGAAVLMSTNMVLLRLAASSSYRKRASAGRRSPLGIFVLFPAAAVATAFGVGSDVSPYPWVMMVGLIPLFAFSEYRRRQLALVPASELSPTLRRWRDEAPGLGELLRHPIRATNANLSFLVQQVRGRRDERQWERDHGLR